MKHWRWYIMLLLSVFAYRILVHGTLYNYVRERGAIGQLFHKEDNWHQYVFKTRKRNAPPAPTAAAAAMVAAAAGREPYTGFLPPAFITLFRIAAMNVLHLFAVPLHHAPPLIPGKVFLKLCCLRR